MLLSVLLILNPLILTFSTNTGVSVELMYVDSDGKGMNLTIQVLDGIFCHNGEMLESKYEPMNKTKEEFLKVYNDSYKDIKESKKIKTPQLNVKDDMEVSKYVYKKVGLDDEQ